jgi:hypothetical protein
LNPPTIKQQPKKKRKSRKKSAKELEQIRASGYTEEQKAAMIKAGLGEYLTGEDTEDSVATADDTSDVE